jgi:hypothetical protein
MKVVMNLRVRSHRFTRADWIGYAVLILVGGVVGLVAVFLPWANAYTHESVNFSLSKPSGINGVMHTQFGPPVLAAALCAVVAAALLLLLGPRRLSPVLSGVVIVAGVVYAHEAVAAADVMGGVYRPGIGLYATLLTGVLLVPIGLASVAVGVMMYRGAAVRGPAGPPATGE